MSNIIDLSDPGIQAKFWSWVDRRGSDECWEWRGGQDGRGYGVFCYKQILYTAHRLAYMEYAKCSWLTKWQMVMHTCGKRNCCNPAHLYLMSASERHRKMADDGIGKIGRGEENMAAKLTAEQVLEIRQRFLEGEARKKLAAEFDISRSEIENITGGKRWAWLQGENS